MSLRYRSIFNFEFADPAMSLDFIGFVHINTYISAFPITSSVFVEERALGNMLQLKIITIATGPVYGGRSASQ